MYNTRPLNYLFTIDDMKFGIIGSGNIGGTLGIHLATAGHHVMFSARNPEKLQGLVKKAGINATAGSVEEAAVFGEVILLAVPFKAVPSLHEKIGDLDGKVLIDANNYYPARDGEGPGDELRSKTLLESQWTGSYFKGASVVKAFNTIDYKTLSNRAFPVTGKPPLVIPFATSDEKADQVILKILKDIGFEGFKVGGLSATRITQPGGTLYGRYLSKTEMEKLIKAPSIE